jgi:hypothetical protein
MSTMPVQLVVGVSCRLPVSVVSRNGDAEKRAKDPSADHSLRLSRLLLSLATDNWHWQLTDNWH